MRWPWRSRGAEPDPVEPAGTGPAPAVAAPRDGWRTLPPLQRTTHAGRVRLSPGHLPCHALHPSGPVLPRALGALRRSDRPGRSGRGPCPARGAGVHRVRNPVAVGIRRRARPRTVRAAQRRAGPSSRWLRPLPHHANRPRTPPLRRLNTPPTPCRPSRRRSRRVAPTVGLDQRPLEVEPGPAAAAVEQPTPVQRAVEPAAACVDPVGSAAEQPPRRGPHGRRRHDGRDPRTTGGPGSLPAVTPRPVPSLPLPVVGWVGRGAARGRDARRC